MMRWRLAMAALLVCVGCGALLGGAAQVPSAPAKEIRVTLLGTAAGPPVFLDRAGIATLVEAGGTRFLFDAGRGVMLQLARAGVRMDGVTKLFLTHLHSDHIVDVPDLMLTPWSAPSERKVPLEVWGPEGTRDMMQHLEQAFAFDIRVRRDIDEGASPEGITVIATDIREGKIYEQDGVTITAFLVDHASVKPAYGYRVDYAGRSVALSGDTRPSDNLVQFCTGVDVLIHEAIDPEAVRKLGASERLVKAIIGHHTTPEQAADIFTRVKPRLAVFSHSSGTQAIVDGTRRTYSGRVEMGEDLTVIDIGDEVRLRRANRTTPPK